MLQQVRFIRLHFRISQSATNIRQRKQKHKQIKKGKTVRNIYTTSEKAARWYKVKATKKQSIKISTNNNSGKLEVSIYKKGRKKSAEKTFIQRRAIQDISCKERYILRQNCKIRCEDEWRIHDQM